MIKSFQFEPYAGALPLRFGMNEPQANEILGEPIFRKTNKDGRFHLLYCVEEDRSYTKIFFDTAGEVREIELDTGSQLWFAQRE